MVKDFRGRTCLSEFLSEFQSASLVWSSCNCLFIQLTWPSVSLSLRSFASLCVCLSVCLSVCLPVCLFICLSVCLFICLFIHLSVHSFVCSLVSLFSWLSYLLGGSLVCLSIHLFVYNYCYVHGSVHLPSIHFLIYPLLCSLSIHLCVTLFTCLSERSFI